MVILLPNQFQREDSTPHLLSIDKSNAENASRINVIHTLCRDWSRLTKVREATQSSETLRKMNGQDQFSFRHFIEDEMKLHSCLIFVGTALSLVHSGRVSLNWASSRIHALQFSGHLSNLQSTLRLNLSGLPGQMRDQRSLCDLLPPGYRFAFCPLEQTLTCLLAREISLLPIPSTAASPIYLSQFSYLVSFVALHFL